MRFPSLARALVLVSGLELLLLAPADAQVVDRLKDAATREAELQVERLLREAMRCMLQDPACPEKAEASGNEVIFVDEEGEVITDEDGIPVTDPEVARERLEANALSDVQSQEKVPGAGVWANYDFVPGDEILYSDDYSGDRVGDFPRRMSFVRGNWEVVEWEGRRLLRNSGPRYAAVEIPLPQEIPDRFTIELDVHMPHGNHMLAVATYSPAADGGNWTRLQGNFFQIAPAQGTGVATRERGGAESLTRTDQLTKELLPVRIMVDGSHARIYVGAERVANVPVAELRRSETLYIENMYMNDPKYPIYIGPIRIAAGGPDLYEALRSEGRAITRGILFSMDSDRIRPESTPTLEAIANMLEEHPELRLRIDGHTDADGDEAYNQQLSERRAAAVERYLVERHGIDDGRLDAAGLGESEPVADNGSAEGKQKNRRVELVRLDAEAGEVVGGQIASPEEPAADSQHPLGAPRDDLHRFYGVYGEAGERRNFFVAAARAAAGDNQVPPGYLMVGAMWGDVQPWHMKSLSDTRFEQAYVGQFQDSPLIVEFHTDDDGRAVALTFTGMFDDRGLLERIGDLPEGR